MDCADVQAVFELVSGWNALTVEQQKQYREAYYDAEYNRAPNPFHEMMLVDAARAWRAELMTTMNIASFVTTDEINTAFEQLKYWTVKQKELISEKKSLQNMRSSAEVAMASDPDFKWGKNETEREAQFRSFRPDLAAATDQNELELQDANNQIALFRLDIERLQTLINFFRTTSMET